MSIQFQIEEMPGYLAVRFTLGPERFAPQRFGELVAQIEGVNVRAFTNVEDAKKWLLE
jgi:hypothetical protein